MGIETYLEKTPFMPALDWIVNWGRKYSIWPVTFGLACCALAMMVAAASSWDISRFGSEVFRPSPRQADLMIVAGTLTKKMAPMVKRIYEQMPEPKFVMALGSCSLSGGVFQQCYNVAEGADKVIPVDVYVPGCPPRPQAIMDGAIKLLQKLQGGK